MKPTIGSLCTGYGGLDLAVSEFFDAETVWTSENDKFASKVTFKPILLSIFFGEFQ